MAEPLSVLRDRYAQPDAAALVAQQYQELLARAQAAPDQTASDSFDWSRMNAPTGEARTSTFSPTQRIGNAAADALMAGGMSPYTANDLTSRIGNVAMASPLGIPASAMDALYAQSQGDKPGVVSAMAGMIPGAGPEARAAASELPRILAGDLRASTRFPTAMKATENPLTHHLNIGTEEMRASPGFEHNVSLLGDYPGFGRLKQMDPEDAVRAYLDQARGNMQYLYSKSPAEMRARSPLWYEGANEISDAFARRWGVPRQSSSAALASLSPQMDWFKNASLGERTGDILTGAAAGRAMTPEMEAFARSAPALQSPKNAELYASIAGKKLDQVDDPLQKALWVRLYDEAHNPRPYREVTPEGNYGGFVLNQDQTPAKIGWGALGEIEKAVRSLESGGNMDVISPALGTKHKVRSFYNNIEMPNDPRFGDITADTHQVAAAQMRPLSGSSPAVAHNLASGIPLAKQPEGYIGEKSSSITGAQGTYGLTADATRMMAMEHDMLPRAAQSATWEPVRELFPAKWKTAKNTAAVDDIWRAYDRGELSIDAARDKIFNLAGGIGTPGWARPGLATTAPGRGSTYR